MPLGGNGDVFPLQMKIEEKCVIVKNSKLYSKDTTLSQNLLDIGKKFYRPAVWAACIAYQELLAVSKGPG